MNALDIIEAKKRGRELAAADIDGLIAGFTSGAVPDPLELKKAKGRGLDA